MVAQSKPTNETSTANNRETLSAVTAYLTEKDPVLFVFREIGDTAAGNVVGAKLVDSEFGEGDNKRVRKNAAGVNKKHLQLYVTSPDGDKLVVNFQSENAKRALNSALQEQNLTGLSIGDFISLRYIDDDEPLREGMQAARAYECIVKPH